MFGGTMMTSRTPISERYARLLLTAWTGGQLASLGEAKHQMLEADLNGLPQSEQERIEMVREIAGKLCSWQGTKSEQPLDLVAAVRLLRHLAGCDAVAA